MDDAAKTKAQLLHELAALRQHVAALEASESAHKRAELKFRGLVEAAPDAMVIVTKDGQVVLVNAQTERLFGYTREELLGQPVERLIPVRLRSAHAAHRTRYVATPQVRPMGASGGLHGLRKDGSEFHVEISLSPLDTDEGLLVLSAIRDVTQHKRMEEALQRQREWFEVTLSSIGDAVLATDTRAAVTFLNPVAEELTGWTAQEALGHHVDEIFHMIDELTGQALECPVVRVLREGHHAGLARHTMLLTRDGREISVADNAAPIRSTNDTLYGVVLVFRDITEQRRLEDELLKARKIESVGVLAGGIAHDFNNLLTSILGNISLAKLFTRLDERGVARLTEAEKACQRATALTHQLLTFSKGGAPVRHTVSIAELLHESIGFALRGANVRCHHAVADDLWPVNVDAGQINQVIHNVLLNAVQAMSGGGAIQVGAENILLSAGCALPLQEGRYVKIAVHDQGRGIPPELLSKIFDPYFTTKEGGSGLGLATAYAIVTKHEGAITVESEVGVGTTVSIYLPASPHAIEPKQECAESPLVGNGRILVMDDEQTVRDLLYETLTTLGYEVDCVRDGEEALALYQRAKVADQAFTAVILDITVPGGMGGRETCEHLRAIDPQVKAIISSGYANDPVMANYAAYGFSGVITKPYTVQGLHNALHRVLENIRD